MAAILWQPVYGLFLWYTIHTNRHTKNFNRSSGDENISNLVLMKIKKSICGKDKLSSSCLFGEIECLRRRCVWGVRYAVPCRCVAATSPYPAVSHLTSYKTITSILTSTDTIKHINIYLLSTLLFCLFMFRIRWRDRSSSWSDICVYLSLRSLKTSWDELYSTWQKFYNSWAIM